MELKIGDTVMERIPQRIYPQSPFRYFPELLDQIVRLRVMESGGLSKGHLTRWPARFYKLDPARLPN